MKRESIHQRIKRLREVAQLSQSDLARRLGVTPQTVQQWELPEGQGGTAPRRKRLPELADIFGIDIGELMGASEGPRGLRASQNESKYLIDVVEVPVFDASASMGPGKGMPDHDTVVDNLRMTKKWVNRNLPSLSGPSNLAAISAYGDSMAPTFNDGDILIVDRGVSELRLDAVYVLAMNGDLYIKRVQRRPDNTVAIISDNPVYQPVIVNAPGDDGFLVLGRVLWAWNGRKL